MKNKKDGNGDKIKINLIETDSGVCFISDCHVNDGYDYTYHQTKLDKFLFDGKYAKTTWHKNWFMIDKYPEKIQSKTVEYVNQRYEIIDKKFISDTYPEIISYDNSEDFPTTILDDLYSFFNDKKEIIRDIEVDFIKVCKVSNFEMKKEYSFNAGKQDITDEKFEHQLLDGIIFPEIMLHSRPCKLSSENVYKVLRQYIIDNINKDVARITSNYDFCFEVKKVIKRIVPRHFTYTDIFARTKRARNKIHKGISETIEKSCFEMTHDRERYKGYTPITEVYGNNEDDLADNINKLCEDVINHINTPINECQHCKGTGLEVQVQKYLQEEG